MSLNIGLSCPPETPPFCPPLPPSKPNQTKPESLTDFSARAKLLDSVSACMPAPQGLFSHCSSEHQEIMGILLCFLKGFDLALESVSQSSWKLSCFEGETSCVFGIPEVTNLVILAPETNKSPAGFCPAWSKLRFFTTGLCLRSANTASRKRQLHIWRSPLKDSHYLKF